MKKVSCILLSFVMIFCMSMPVSATAADQRLENAVEAEIQQRMSALHENLYEQLKAQDAEKLLPVYEEILYPDVVMAVMSKYGLSVSTLSGVSRYYAPNGGIVAGTVPINADGYSDLEVTKIGMTEDDAKEWLIRNQGDYINIGDLLSDVASTIMGDFGFLASLFDISGYLSDKTIDEIEACGWNLMVVNTHDTEYDLYASTYVAWEDYPYILVNPDGDYTFKPIS